jgi:dihydrofolate reductase
VFIATSLDGFIARSNGSIDWLEEANAAVPHDEDGGYKAFYSSVDVIVMGRKSFEKCLTFPDWPYKAKKMIVLSRNVKSITELVACSPTVKGDEISESSESPTSLVNQLTTRGFQRAYVDGGATIQGFLDAGLIDDMCITVAPVLLGSGLPLFGHLSRGDLNWKLISCRSFHGFTQASYEKRQ